MIYKKQVHLRIIHYIYILQIIKNLKKNLRKY
mgnify:CR=1 FL=1|jgi:hypothetical protein